MKEFSRGPEKVNQKKLSSSNSATGNFFLHPTPCKNFYSSSQCPICPLTEYKSKILHFVLKFYTTGFQPGVQKLCFRFPKWAELPFKIFRDPQMKKG